MGSYDAAVMTGFICRLCSELNRNVVHIYSEKGKDLKLAEKINLMPISVEPQDSLPKTICRSCISQLDSQYRLIQQLRRNRNAFIEHQLRVRQALNQTEASTAPICATNSTTSDSTEPSDTNSVENSQ